MPYRQTPTPKKEIDYNVSGTKILFSQDLEGEENNKSPFSFLKRQNSLPDKYGRGTREAFNNITNTINKSPFFEDNHISKITDACAPKLLKFEAKQE